VKHESYELKWAGECVADGYRKQMELAYRGQNTQSSAGGCVSLAQS
jgi:hypothetical protein